MREYKILNYVWIYLIKMFEECIFFEINIFGIMMFGFPYFYDINIWYDSISLDSCYNIYERTK